MATIRAIWAIQDKIALTPDEEKAIQLKREVVAADHRWLESLLDAVASPEPKA